MGLPDGFFVAAEADRRSQVLPPGKDQEGFFLIFFLLVHCQVLGQARFG